MVVAGTGLAEANAAVAIRLMNKAIRGTKPQRERGGLIVLLSFLLRWYQHKSRSGSENLWLGQNYNRIFSDVNRFESK
ncbi:hypothetical protein COT78_03855 [Candidatus Berkelbacteria bacterium CG10_big_fil_rev_8_21_14_0_10_43_13]|uniref:Uncharacterized protein n=1 Tax=Candidatus Berkelbacteria bacterium CG10_big_fil_rev_8_21_14_0_10_43_13 TaxID=1974514 RepID=A0A2H0W5Q4_9BACT|nr:MAG: hypothetical protein COT78_03855 [Candidatus Berkelbacteria bacterium CG10_big_fil_rev_8_21_14_0_10_43_13]